MNELMMPGYVYVLVNSSFPDLVKIGKTTKDPAVRARELRLTGVPTPFVVAYSVYVSDCGALEKSIHDELDKLRHSGDREFFTIDAKSAIDTLIERSRATIVEGQATALKDSYFYVYKIEPFSAENNSIYMASRIVDDEAFQTFAGCFPGRSPDDDEVFFCPLRDARGNRLKDLYRVGFTQIVVDDLYSDFLLYMEHGLGMHGLPKLTHYEKLPAVDLDELMRSYAEVVISSSERLLYCDLPTINRLISAVSEASKHIQVEMERIRAATESQTIATSLRRRL